MVLSWYEHLLEPSKLICKNYEDALCWMNLITRSSGSSIPVDAHFIATAVRVYKVPITCICPNWIVYVWVLINPSLMRRANGLLFFLTIETDLKLRSQWRLCLYRYTRTLIYILIYFFCVVLNVILFYVYYEIYYFGWKFSIRVLWYRDS